MLPLGSHSSIASRVTHTLERGPRPMLGQPIQPPAGNLKDSQPKVLRQPTGLCRSKKLYTPPSFDFHPHPRVEIADAATRTLLVSLLRQFSKRQPATPLSCPLRAQAGKCRRRPYLSRTKFARTFQLERPWDLTGSPCCAHSKWPGS